MIDYFIPLLSAYLSSGLWLIYLIPLFALFVIVTVPVLLRFVLR